MYLLDRLFGESARVAAPAVPQYTQGEQNRLKLAAMLRDKSQWPEGFTWDFRSFSTCAMGMWDKKVGFARDPFESRTWEHVRQPFGLTEEQAKSIFAGRNAVDALFHGASITPEMIADQLEATVTGVA